jgi:uncharacterized protein involved in cysteine biosynthesis
MENNSAFDSFELQITTVAQGFLRETAKWAKFLSILGFIFIGLYVLVAFSMFAMGGAMASEDMSGMEGMGGMGSIMAMGGTALGIIYLLVALLYFFPVMYLYKFASNTKEALNSNSTDRLTTALENLKSHYKFMGILMVVALVFVVVAFIIAIIGVGAAAASGM